MPEAIVVKKIEQSQNVSCEGGGGETVHMVIDTLEEMCVERR
jgi:hypothetical protein